MATNSYTYSTAFITAALLDYTGTPNSLAVPGLVRETLSFPEIDLHERTEVPINSSTGTSRYARPDHGLALGQQVSFTSIVSDIANDADKNFASLCRALANNSVSGTAHSTETYTSQLTGGGALQCKLVLTFRNTNGSTAVLTLPITIDSVVETAQNGTTAYAVTGTLVGAITRT